MSARQRAEATQTTTSSTVTGVTVTWRKTRFRLPPPEQFPLEAIEMEEAGKPLTALKLILGETQYATWKTLASTLADVEDFSATVMGALGRGNR